LKGSLMPRILRRSLYVQPVLVLSLFVLLMVLPGRQSAMWNALRSTASSGSTFVVTNTNDSGPGSLRQAITDANASPGLDTISFNIGSGLQTITPQQRLPTITDGVVIDGTTQPGFSGVPIIELNGTVQPDGNGLFITGGNSTVRGLVINRFHFTGILINNGSGNRVEGCYIGTDSTGTIAQPNGDDGVSISTSNNVIGGTTPTQHNVISGNQGAGIDISRFCCTGDTSSITGNVVQGNFIGVNSTGSAAIPNLLQGVRISNVNSNVPVTNNLVGGTQPGAGNLISGNHGVGIDLEGNLVTNNSVQGNFIGTDATGSFAVPNDRDGITITGNGNLIGGPTAGARNVISGNGRAGAGGNGVSVNSFIFVANIIQGNIIGANATLTAPLPNVQYGVLITTPNHIVGGTAPGEGNIIAFNGFDGVLVTSFPPATGNVIRGNSIFSNGYINHPVGITIGIDLGVNGVTLNDAGDGDTGANNLQNFPIITLVTVGVNSVNVKGTLNSTASQTFTLDFYANSVCDATGFGEGARYIGAAMVTTDGVGNGSFDATFAQSLPANQVITATATDATSNTSEFSQCSPSSPAVGAISFNPTAPQVSESSGFATFNLTRTGGTAGSIAVGYTVTGGGTASPGSDFTPVTGSVTFADGESSKTFFVPIVEDNVDEADETATARLSTTGDLDTLGAASTATLNILDNDPSPSMAIGDVSASEGNSGTTDFTFPVTLSAASERTVSANFFTQSGTAVGGSDFQQPNTNMVTFAPGQTSATITISVIGDTSVEADETFFVNISGPQNATLADGQGKATIVNDDNTFQFSNPSFSFNENVGSGVVTVTRSAGASGEATVQYATNDNAGGNNCSTVSGHASSRCDFVSTLGTLHFAAGETSQTVSIPLVDDSYAEGNESFTVTLSNPSGATLLAPGVATVNIVDNDAVNGPNPIDQTDFFVRQHYIDFLNREPDPAGLAFWSNQITECQQPGATCSVEVRRINVSAAFFLSIEFQETGYFVYRTYKASYGNIAATPVPVTLAEFLPDTQQIGKDVIVGQPGAEQQLEANKVAFALDFVSRSRFTAAYPTTLTPAEFVDALFTNAGVVPSATDRNAAINEFGGAGNTADTAARARALRRVAENSTLKQQETNKAFVLMQYFGYLRRNPNDPPEAGLNFDGYNFWLNKLNEFNGNFVNAEMVKAFLVSGEYRQRFGP
jgi:Calx-beta domain